LNGEVDNGDARHHRLRVGGRLGEHLDIVHYRVRVLAGDKADEAGERDERGRGDGEELHGDGEWRSGCNAKAGGRRAEEGSKDE
jgi:hypothetical protein